MGPNKFKLTAKEMINKMKRQLTELKKIVAKSVNDKGLIFKTYKELCN